MSEEKEKRYRADYGELVKALENLGYKIERMSTRYDFTGTELHKSVISIQITDDKE